MFHSAAVADRDVGGLGRMLGGSPGRAPGAAETHLGAEPIRQYEPAIRAAYNAADGLCARCFRDSFDAALLASVARRVSQCFPRALGRSSIRPASAHIPTGFVKAVTVFP